MRMNSDATTASALKSWIKSANVPSSDFSIQNLPFGIFKTPTNPQARVGVAIGDQILDLVILAKYGLLDIDVEIVAQPSLNDFVATGRAEWRRVRQRISELLSLDQSALRDDIELRSMAFASQSVAMMLLPFAVPGYTDFYSSKEHATNVGTMFRDPKNALLPNWLEIPIGYNGRASSIVVSGTPIRRPNGQIKASDQLRPKLARSEKLDMEMETGFFIGKPNEIGAPIDCESAEDHIFGMVLLNDWSARDIQAWEYVPLGPFNSKSFATTISPWVVTLDALQPFRTLQPMQFPEPLPYLRQVGGHAFDIQLEATIRPNEGCTETTIARTNFRYLYWSMAQQLAHHTISGCNTEIGDLMGSGTISGTAPDSLGSFLELSLNGARSIKLDCGGKRTFIEDGDEIILRGWCQGDGYRVGFGNCAGKILPALSIENS
jgi:fumarylacetoacetase